MLSDIIMSIKNVTFASVVCQTEIKTPEDKKRCIEDGLYAAITVDEMKAICDIDPACIYYAPSLSLDSFYFNKETMAACPLHVMAMASDPTGAHIDKGVVQRVVQSVERDVAEGDYTNSLLTLTDAMRMEYFSMLIQKAQKEKTPIPNLYHLFFEVYSYSDYGFNGMDMETFKAVVKAKTPKEKAATTRKLKKLPDVITVYRGGNSASTPYKNALSWTLDINVANFFAIRRGYGPGHIVKGQVQKADVVEYLEDRNEKEIVALPESVKDIEVLDLPGMDFLEETLPLVIPMYKAYREKLRGLDWTNKSSVHGIEHSGRVLLLTLILSEMLDLSMADRRVLATAAIYHDTRRTHDGVEPDHGKKARAYYHNSVANPDPLVEFLIEYHALADEEGYAEIKANRQLSKKREHSIRLFNIFKDADGLDRLRLGDIRRVLDLNQLRLRESKTLPLVSRICMEQLKVADEQ